jgi:Tfp pilus assembly protein PilE
LQHQADIYIALVSPVGSPKSGVTSPVHNCNITNSSEWIMSHHKESRQKFNKMELVISGLVLTVLFSVAFPIYFVTVTRSKISTPDKSLNTLGLSLRQYRSQNGSYPLERKFVSINSLPVQLDEVKLTTDYFTIKNFTYTSWDGRSYVIRLIGEGENTDIRRQVTNTGIYSNF